MWVEGSSDLCRQYTDKLDLEFVLIVVREIQLSSQELKLVDVFRYREISTVQALPFFEHLGNGLVISEAVLECREEIFPAAKVSWKN